MEDYKTYYKDLDSLKLVSLLRNESDYNSEAIFAAKNELENRNLSDFKLKQINQNLDAVYEQDVNSNLNLIVLKEKAENEINDAFEISNKELTQSDIDKIKMFSVLLILLSGLTILSHWDVIKYVANNEMTTVVPYFKILMLSSIIFPIVAGITLWSQMKTGYYLSFLITSICILAHVILIINIFNVGSSTTYEIVQSLIFSSIMILTLIYGLTFLLKKNVKMIYLN